MKKAQYYSLCLQSAQMVQTPTFKVKVSKFQTTVNPYFIPSQVQIYHYETIIERINQPEIIIECYFNQKIKAVGKIKFDTKQNQIISQKVELLENNKTKLADLIYSLIKIQKKLKKPTLKIELVQASYDQNKDNTGKMDPFVVVKYGDLNFKSKTAEGQGQTPVWKQFFKTGDSDIDRIYIESWEEDAKISQYIGVTIIEINININTQKQYDVKLLGKKVGTIKIGLYENEFEEKASKKIQQQPLSKPTLSKQKSEKLGGKIAQINSRYSGKQSINDYMADLNVKLQQGMLKIAKQRPQDPIRELGLFLINCKKQ